MKDKGKKENPLKRAFNKLINEWGIALSGLFRPLVLIPIGISITSLYFAADITIDKKLSLVLNITATISLAFAGSFFYDAIKTSLGNNLLTKKGLSAVRNLSLARSKIKNITERTKNAGSTEETINLFSLLEKDIANATQECNDILPGVDEIEKVYILLSEKEVELKNTITQKKELQNNFEKEKELGDSDKIKLEEKIGKYGKKVSELKREIDILKITTSSPSSLDNTSLAGVFGLSLIGTDIHTNIFSSSKFCTKCGESYTPSLILGSDKGLCNDCDSSGIGGLTF